MADEQEYTKEQLDADKERVADTNVEGIGSEEHRDLREDAAKKEKAWKGAGKEPGVQIWRIEKFKVKKWPKKRYGEFYSGDSYIILHTKKDAATGKLSYDVFFWLGKETTQDEAGVAAYKTVELDDLLGDEPVQYREVQGNESRQFLDCFDKITILDGGVDSGFNSVKPKEYKPRLLHVSGYGQHVQVFQVKMDHSSLNNVDSFIIDAGLMVYAFHGPKATVWERRKANAVVQEIRENRHGKVQREIHIDGLKDDQNEADEFWKTYFSGKPDVLTDDEEKKEEHKMAIMQISDAEAEHVSVTTVCDGYLDEKVLDSNDAFIIDTGLSLYIWIGKGANKAEKLHAMEHATQFLADSGRDPMSVPICRVLEGKEPPHFKKIMKSKKKKWDADMIAKDEGYAGRQSVVGVLRELDA